MYSKTSLSPNKKITRVQPPLQNIQQDLTRTFDNLQSKSKLHSSLTTKNAQQNNTNTKPKSSQQLLESWYNQHNKPSSIPKTSRITTNQTDPASLPSKSQDNHDYENSKGSYENKMPAKIRGQVGHFERESSYFTNTLQRNEDSYNTQKGLESMNNKSFQSQNVDNAQLRKYFSKEIRINLGTYAIEKVMLKIKCKIAWNTLKDIQTLCHQSQKKQKVFKSVSPQKPLKGRVFVEPQDNSEESSLEGMIIQKQQHTPRRLNDSYENRKRDIWEAKKGNSSSKGPISSRKITSSILRTEHIESDSSMKESEIQKRTEISEKNNKNVKITARNTTNQLCEEELKAMRREKAIKIIHKAIVVIQRAVRRFLKTKKNIRNSIALAQLLQNPSISSKSPRLEKGSSLHPKGSLTEKKNESSSAYMIIEQLTSELNLAKKRTSYFQAENEKLEAELKKMEKNIEKTVAEKLTIERARVKDSLKEYSFFIDQLLAEKKELEQKAETHTKLITELCARLENNNAIHHIKELEENLRISNIEKQNLQNEYEKLCIQIRELYEEKKELVPCQQYSEAINERDCMKLEIIELKTKLEEMETKFFQLQKKNGSNKNIDEISLLFETQAISSNEGSIQRNTKHFKSNLPKKSSLNISGTEMGYQTAREFSKANSLYKSSGLLGLIEAQNRSQTPCYKDKISKLNLSYTEPEIKSARGREPLEFSFEVKEKGEVDFKEPFRLSITLEEKVLMEGNAKEYINLKEKKCDSKEKKGQQDLNNTEESLDLDDLISNLGKRLYLKEENVEEVGKSIRLSKPEKGTAKSTQNYNTGIPKSLTKSSENIITEETTNNQNMSQIKLKIPEKEQEIDIKFGVLETLKKAENIFQKLSKSDKKP